MDSVTQIRLLVLLGLVFYLAPTVMVLGRPKRNKVAIIALNIVGGWTVVGWIIALVWSLTDDDKPAASDRAPAPRER
jgi:hypothetical protein